VAGARLEAASRKAKDTQNYGIIEQMLHNLGSSVQAITEQNTHGKDRVCAFIDHQLFDYLIIEQVYK
jgi:hypothetical protein